MPRDYIEGRSETNNASRYIPRKQKFRTMCLLRREDVTNVHQYDGLVFKLEENII